MRSKWKALSVILIILSIGIVLNYENVKNFLLTSPYGIERQNAYNYLQSHYNNTLGLIYESEDTGISPDSNLPYTQTFWIISDNLLVYQAVSSYNSTLSNQIRDTVFEYFEQYGIDPPFLYEVLYGENIPDTIHVSEKHILEITSNYAILIDRHNGTEVMNDWDQYGDLLVYRALDYRWSGNNTMAEYCYKKAYDMFDGKGVYDIAAEKDKRYVNYKLALLIYASKVLELDWDKISEIEAQLWSMQKPITGGITSLADINGIATGSANCETTALALIAYYENLIGPPIGAYYYPWYGSGGLNVGRHWNDSIYNIVMDEPIFYDYYDSQNIIHVRKQIRLMADIGIDFVIISWWGDKSYEDNATRSFIETNIAENSPLKFCIFVEPYTKKPNYTFIYDYIYENYVSPYSSIYFRRQDKPLLCWFNPLNPPKNDTRFTDRVVGHSSYVDWTYWREDAKIETEGYIVVSPRYDDYYLYKYGGRDSYQVLNRNYTGSMYDEQWAYVINNHDKVKIVLICSWNEYHERTMIEPHNDISSPDNTYAYVKTQEYIKLLRQQTASDTNNINSIKTGLLIVLVFSIVVIGIKKIYY